MNAFDEFDTPTSASPAARVNAFDEFDANAKPEGAFARAGRVLLDPDGGVMPAIGSLLVSAMPESKARGATGYAKDTGVDLTQGVVSLGESVVGLGDLASFGLVGKGLQKLGYDPKATSQFLAGAYSEDRQEAEKNVDAAKGFTDTLGALAVNPSALLGRIVQSVPGTVGAGAAGGALVRRALPAAVEAAAARGLTGAAAEAFIVQQVAKTATLGGAAAEGALSAGSIAESGRQAGKDFTDYAGPAVVGGAVTGAIGVASGAIGRKLGIGDVEADIAARSAGVKGVAQTAGGRFAAAGKEGLKEGFLEEAPQSFNEAIATNLATGKPWDTELGKQTAEGLAAGLGMGAGHAAIFRPSEKRAIAEQQMADATDVDQIAAAAVALAGDVREFQDAHAEFRQSVVAEKQQLPADAAAIQQNPERSIAAPFEMGDSLNAVNQAPALRDAHQVAEAARRASSLEEVTRQIEERINAPLPERTQVKQTENTEASQRLAAAALEAPYVAENATPTLPATPVDAELSRRGRSTASNDVAFSADVAAGRISREDIAATLPAPESKTFPGTSILKASAKRGLDTLQAHYQSTGRAAALTEVDPVSLPSAKDVTPDENGDLPLSREVHGAAVAMAKAFGKKVVLFSSTERVGDGAVLTNDANTIYLNVNAQKPHLIIVGHEITHQMKMQSPAAYAAFEKVVKEQLGDEGMAAYQKDYAGGDIEEASSDLIGNRFEDPVFMQKVFEQVGRDLAPAKALGAVTRMANAIHKVVEGVKATLRRQDSFAVDTMVKDLDKVKEAAHTALVAYAKQRTQIGNERTQNENVEQGRDEVGRFTALDSPYRNNGSGEGGKPMAASAEAISRQADEKAKGQTRLLVDRDGTVRPLIGPTAVDQKAYPGQVILQKNVGAGTWTVLSKGAGVGMSHEGRALDAARRWDRDAKQSPKRPEELLAAVKPRFRAPLAQAFTGLSEVEIGKLQASTATKMVGLLKQLPGVDETAAIAWSGRAKRGWYRNSSLAMASVFGPDAPRFTALLAALSPQTSVELNLQNALQAWKNWTAAGRPTNPKEIRKIMGRSVQGDKGEKSVLGAWVNNSVSALTVEDPVNTQYSGPKVNSFFQNLVGNAQEVTNDTWMANYALIEQVVFGGAKRKINGKKIGDKGWGYLAMNSHVRQVAARLTELTGEEWTPAEVQETVWSWAKALYEAQKDGVSATELLYNEELTDEMVNATPSFATLFTKDTYANILTSAGLGDSVARLRDEAASGKFETSPKREGQTAPFDSGAQSSFEVAAARRLEKLKEEGRPDRLRDAKESAKRQTETPEFKRWFGDSKVVDASGEPLVVYHATPEDFAAFTPGGRNPKLSGAAIWVAPNAYEQNAAHNTRAIPGQPNRVYSTSSNKFTPGTRVMPLYASLKNPLVSDDSNWRAVYRETDGGSPWTLYPESVAKIKALGFDGVMHYRGEVLEEAAAFDPEQIKSAIGNNGTFDPSDPDIRRSPKRNIHNAIVKPTWQAPAPSMLDDVLYRLQNKHIDLKRVTEAIGKIPDRFDAYLGETLYHGRSAKQVQDFASQELKPLIQELKARNVELEDFEEYLHNRHAEERNVQVAKINPAMPDGGSGLKTADARAYLRGLTALQQRNYAALAARVDRINAGTRALLVSSGLETQETVDAWQRTYGKYVPLQRAEMDIGHAGAGTGAGFSTRGSASKRATGSDREVVDILANLVLQRENTITRAEKNRVGNALMGLAIQNPNTDFWLPVNPDAKLDPVSQNKLMVELIGMGLNPMDADGIIKEPTQRYVDPKTGLVTERINPALRGRENVIATRVEGRDRFLFLNEKDPRASRMGDAIKNLDAKQLGEILTGLGKVSRWISQVNTQYNPIFGMMNFTRDVQAAALNLSTTPLAGKQKEVLSHVMPALRGIYLDVRATRKGQPSTSTWSQLWEEFQREGGQTGYKSMYAGSAERTEELHKELKALSEGKLKQGGRAVLDWLTDYNDSIENSTRLAAYKVAKDSGLSNARAAELAKDITVNFNRKGEVATQAGALYAFFNAAVQGTERTVRTLTGPTGRKIIYGGLLLGVLQALALTAAGFDDGDPPDQVKERNFVLPLGDQTYATIPMPLGFNVIPGSSRLATEFVLRGFKSPTKLLSGFITLATSLNPIGNSSTLSQTLAPTALDPIVALGQNKDNFGRPIAREDHSGLKPTPGFTRKKDTATPWSTALAEAINWVTGGTKYTPGMASPTPDQIDYLVGQVGGGVAREVGKVVQTAQSQVTGEALPPYKVPILGRLYGDSKTPAARAAHYYQNVQKIGEHELELAGRRKDHTGGIAEYIAEHPDAVLVPTAKQIEQRVSELRAKKSKALEAGDSAKVKLYEELISVKMQQLNDRVKELQAK